MTSKQYEELCRHFLAGLFQIPFDQVQSIDIPNPRRPELPSYAHQIDLYWEIETPAAHYLHIANAKWRTPPNYVDLNEVLLLQQVKTKVGAHKAILMTNFGFSDGAMATALDEGMALHLVRPGFDYRRLHHSDPAVIQSQLQSLARMHSGRPLCVPELLLKGLPPGTQEASAPAQPESVAGAPLGSTRVLPPILPRQAPQSSPSSAADAASGRSFQYVTKLGPPPGFIKK